MTKLEIKAIPSSFVARNAKLLQDVGAGEAKLFVGSTARASEFDSFFDFDSNLKYRFDKNNLLEYLKQVKIEYVYQAINQYKELDLNFWNEVELEISGLSDDDMICHLTRFTDQSRYYVRADEDIFRKTFRKIALPKITNLVFEKESDDCIWLRLYVNYEYSRAQDMINDTESVIENANVEGSYSIDELGAILKEMYTHAKGSGQVAAIHMFGFKFGNVIDKCGYSSKKILEAAGMGDTKYDAEISKGVNIYRSVKENEYGVRFYHDDNSSQGDEFLNSWNLMIADVINNGNQLVIFLARTQHTLVWEDDRFCDTAYAAPAKQYIDFDTVKSVYLGSFVIKDNSGTNAVKISDSKAIIKILADKYGLSDSTAGDEYSWHKSDPTDEEYSLFKGLLSYFITQLNINNGVIEGERKFANAGSEGSKLLIAEWNHFNGFELSCRFARGYQLTQDMASYLNYAWVNINPHYNRENKTIESIKVNVKPNMVVLYDGENYSIDSLDLFSENAPNEALKALFVEFRDEIYKWQTGVYSDEQPQDNGFNSYNYNDACAGGENLVVYGTPGCGKFYVDHTKLGKNDDGDYVGDYNKDNIIRTTFYLDYSNTDFIGQIVPVIEYEEDGRSTVTYKFVPGPFAIALECAFAHSTEKVALVIEELNRGNAPCIFGDLFQLLDRIDEEGKDYPIGTSEYGILNTSLINYLRDNEHYNKQYHYSFDLDEIRIPANLSIYATMNTSDQNVFTLDTAFKRRWGFEKLSNKFDDPMKGKHPYKDYFVPGLQHVTWESFVDAINNYIVRDNDLLTSEDKQLGVFFVTKKMLIDPSKEDQYTVDELKKIKDKFAYKVFEYLWDDVAKFSRDKWFGNIKTLDELIKKYVNEEKVFANDIFQQ